MFLAVTIDIYVLFLIPSEAKFKERNELIIGKEVTLTFFVVTIWNWVRNEKDYFYFVNQFFIEGKSFSRAIVPYASCDQIYPC